MGIKVEKFTPTHVHVEGGEYEVLDYPRVKIEGHWFSGVLYRNRDNILCVRTLEGFEKRFSVLRVKR